MSDNKKKNEIDFLPMNGINNDFIKIYNEWNDISDSHLAIHKLVTLIELPPGKHRFLPNLGLKTDFLSLPFTDDSLLPNKMTEIENKIEDILGLNIEINYEMVEKEGRRHLIIKLGVKNLPSKLEVTVQSDNTKNIAERLSTRILS